MLQVQKGKIERKNNNSNNNNKNKNREKTRRQTGKLQEVFGIWITHILFQIIHINGLLKSFAKEVYSKSTVTIIVLQILLRHFHSKRSISIMTASFCFTRKIPNTIFVILLTLK